MNPGQAELAPGLLSCGIMPRAVSSFDAKVGLHLPGEWLFREKEDAVPWTDYEAETLLFP